MKEAFQKVVKYSQTPIQFYAAIIIVFASLIFLLAWKSGLAGTIYIIIFCLLIIVSVLIWVSWLLIKNPTKLVLGKEEYITMMRERLGDNIRGEYYYSLDIIQTKAPEISEKTHISGDGEDGEK